MASPQSDTYIGTGGIIAAGRFHRPAWRNAMSAGVWAPVGTHTLSAINPENDPAINADYPGTAVWRKYSDGGTSGGHPQIIGAWNGACYDRDNDRIWLPNQGGHGDYGGNESYEFTLRADSPVWTMPLPPSGSKPYLLAEGIPAGATPLGNSYLLADGEGDNSYGEISGHYADGRPRASHTYNKPVYIPGVGPMITNLGGTFRGSQVQAENAVWQLVESNKTWVLRGQRPLAGGLSASNGGAVYHQQTNAVYWVGAGNSKLCKFSLDTGVWTNPGSSKLESYEQLLIAIPGVYDSILHLSSSGLRLWNVVTGTFIMPTLLDTPSGILGIGFRFGADWCERLGCIVIWRGLSGSTKDLLTITPTGALADPWQWGTVPATGSPPAETGNGTFGRFGYSPRLNGFWVLSSTAQPVWFMPLD